MKSLARLLGCTEGQAYSAAIVAIVATVMVVIGVPPALRDHAAPLAAFGAEAGHGTAATTTTTSVAIPRFGEAPAPQAAIATTPAPAVGAPVDSGGDGPRFAAGEAPAAVAVADGGEVYIGSGGTIYSFNAKGALRRAYEMDAPVRGLAVEDAGHVVVIAERRVVRLDLEDGSHSTIARIPDVPVCGPLPAASCEPGVQDHAPDPHGVALDGRERLLVTDAGQATIWMIDPDHPEPRAWYQALDLASGDGPTGIDVAGGQVRFTVGTTLDVSAPAQGAAYELVTSSDGSAGSRTLLAAFGRGTSPDGIVVGRSGRTYVALQGADAVVVLARDHVEEARLTEGMDAPAGLGLGDGSLLVANLSRRGHGRVVTVTVDDAAT